MKVDKSKWERVALGDVCVNVKNVDQKKESGTFSYIDIGSIDSEIQRVKEAKEVDWSEASSRARQIVFEGDTLFSTVRVNLMKIAFVTNEFDNNIASTGFCVLRANPTLIDSKFLFYSCLTPTILDNLINLQAGTAYPAVTNKMVFEQQIVLPPIDFQKQFGELLFNLETTIEQTTAQTTRLKGLKRQLLRDLFNEKEPRFGHYLSAKDTETQSFAIIALNQSSKIEPKNSQDAIYVGLEHIDTDNLRITRHGSPEDVIGIKLKVRKGDLIFGKRRAYQRKVGIADFDGICSAHALVLRANETYINKDFLPYFMQSDCFMERAVQISEGSLSPTIKWKVLAQQKFVLPKKEKQKVIADVFKNIDAIVEQLTTQVSTLRVLKQKLLSELLG